MKTKILAVVLSLCMLLSFIPMSVYAENENYIAGDGAFYLMDVPESEELSANYHTTSRYDAQALPIVREGNEYFFNYSEPYFTNTDNPKTSGTYSSTIDAASLTYGTNGVPESIVFGDGDAQTTDDLFTTYVAVRIKVKDNSPAFGDEASGFGLSIMKSDGTSKGIHTAHLYGMRWLDLSDGSMTSFVSQSGYNSNSKATQIEFTGNMNGYLLIPFSSKYYNISSSTTTQTDLLTEADFREAFNGFKLQFFNAAKSSYTKASTWYQKQFLLGDAFIVNDADAFASARCEKYTQNKYSPNVEDTASYAFRVGGYRSYIYLRSRRSTSKAYQDANLYGYSGNYDSFFHVTTLPNGDRAYEIILNSENNSSATNTSGYAMLSMVDTYDYSKVHATNGAVFNRGVIPNGRQGVPENIPLSSSTKLAFRIATKDGTVENETIKFSMLFRMLQSGTTNASVEYNLKAGDITYVDINTGDTQTLTVGSDSNIVCEGNLDGYLIVDKSQFKNSSGTALTASNVRSLWGGAQKRSSAWYEGEGFKILLNEGFTNSKAIYVGDIFFVEDSEKFLQYRCEKSQGGHTLAISPAVEPTCTEKGYTEGAYCVECGKVLSVQTEIAALGHTSTSVTIPATSISAGYTEHTCSVCHKVYRDNFVDSLAGTNATLGIGMFRFTGDVNNYLTDGVNTNADKLAELEDVLAQGYVNTIFIDVDSLINEKVALCREYNCKFWIGPGRFSSKTQTIETYIANVEVKVNKIIEAGAWDLFLGFDWDEPIWNGMSNQDFYTMTKALYEKWGKRNFPIFAVGSFIDGYGNYTTIDPECMEYVTDAGWDLYSYDVRDSALTNEYQNNAIASNNAKYGINCETAQDYYRWVHSEMMEKMNHDVNVWFFPAAYNGVANTKLTHDESYWTAHLNFFANLLSEQTKPGGLILYNYSGSETSPALEQRLPVPNITTGEQIMFADIEKWTSFANRLKEVKTQFDNTPVTVAKYLPSTVLNITEIGSEHIDYIAVDGFEYSIDGGLNWQSGSTFAGLVPETAYSIRVKETQSGAYKDFEITTKALRPYASGLNDTASYAIKMPTELNLYTTVYGHVGAGMGRTSDDSDFVTTSATKYLHLKTIDGERFIEIRNNNCDANSNINLAFGDNGRATSKVGISEGVDTAPLTAFAFRVKTTGGTDDQLSIFDFYINGHRTTRAASYPIKYIDKATGSVTNMTYQNGLNITGNIDGWIVIPFASYQAVDGNTSANNKNWIVNNLKTFQPWLHEENCSNHNASASSWDNDKRFYMGDVMYVENVDTFISVRTAQ